MANDRLAVFIDKVPKDFTVGTRVTPSPQKEYPYVTESSRGPRETRIHIICGHSTLSLFCIYIFLKKEF